MISFNKLLTIIVSIYSVFFYVIGVQIFNFSHIPITFTFMPIIILLFIGVIYFNDIQFTELYIVSPFFILNLIYIIRYSGEVLLIIYQFFFMFMILLFKKVEFTDKNIKVIAITFIFLILINFYLAYHVDDLLQVVSNVSFVKGILNGNTVSMYGFYLSYIPVLYFYNSKNKFSNIFLVLIIGITLATVILSGSRSILISLFTVIITVLLWKFITQSFAKYRSYFWFILFTIILFIFIYPNLDKILPNFTEFDQFILDLTGKRIMSGRNSLWSFAWNLIGKYPIRGYGSAAMLSDYMIIDLEAHNLLLQIGFQIGILGIILLVLFLSNIWKTLFFNRDSKYMSISAGYFMGMIVHQTFEISLIQNGFDRSFFPWLIIAFSLSFAVKIFQREDQKIERIS